MITTHSVKYLIIVGAALVCGCAATPPSTSAKGQTAAAAGATTIKASQFTGQQIVSLEHAGYDVVDKNGVKMYCRTEGKLGSHIQKETTCMTAEELVALREQTQRNLQNFTLQQPPPAGK